MCQRYYYRYGGSQLYELFGNGVASSVTQVNYMIASPVTMRVSPTAIEFSTIGTWQGGTIFSISALTIASNQSGKNAVAATAITTSAVLNNPYLLISNNSTSGFVAFSAEL
jgi:hypothetical protein